MSSVDAQVAVIGGGVVGCAVAHALARRGVRALLLEAEPALALGASGANSGILHTGFDSTPGELETRLILRSVQLRDELLEELGVAVWRCGARLQAHGGDEHAAITRLAENAHANGVQARLGEDGTLNVPGESVTNPVAFVHALADAAQAGGAKVRLSARVTGLAKAPRTGLLLELGDGERLRAAAAVNCAGLFADEVARLAGDDPVSVYPRKGEFLVFSAPEREPLEQILLPVPSALGKGVLVFPTIDREIVAGPTARERRLCRPAPRRPQRQLRDRELAHAARADPRRGDPLDRAFGLAGHRRARGRAAGRAGGSRARPDAVPAGALAAAGACGAVVGTRCETSCDGARGMSLVRAGRASASGQRRR
jgi:glycerol-3-phosphate dehydrogenase